MRNWSSRQQATFRHTKVKGPFDARRRKRNELMRSKDDQIRLPKEQIENAQLTFFPRVNSEQQGHLDCWIVEISVQTTFTIA